ncbi:hypothetical protein EV175_006632, partial [Coemansia sp. RSA 1933]
MAGSTSRNSAQTAHTASTQTRTNARGIRTAYSSKSVLDHRALLGGSDHGGSGQQRLLEACVSNDLHGFLEQTKNARIGGASVFDGGHTPLMVAARANAVRIVHWVCLNGNLGTVNHKGKYERGNAALHYASARGNIKCVAALLSSGAQAHEQNMEGATALHYAAYRGHKDVVVQIAARSSSVVSTRDKTGKTALMLAAFRGHTQTVSTLLQLHSGVDVQDKAGWTALMYAAYTGRVAICRELLDCKADHTPTEYATRRRAAELAHDSGYYEVADMLRGTEHRLRSPNVPDGVQMPAMMSPPQIHPPDPPVSDHRSS